MFIFKSRADLYESDGKGSRTKVKEGLKMTELEEEKAGVKGKQRINWGGPSVSDTAQVCRTITPLWAAGPMGV